MYVTTGSCIALEEALVKRLRQRSLAVPLGMQKMWKMNHVCLMRVSSTPRYQFVGLLDDFLFVHFFRCQRENNQRKKSEGKKVRDDKDKVMNILFAAFEKHQYYNIKDLAGITRQPVVSPSFGLSKYCEI